MEEREYNGSFGQFRGQSIRADSSPHTKEDQPRRHVVHLAPLGDNQNE
jgi:hypothetical protein